MNPLFDCYVNILSYEKRNVNNYFHILFNRYKKYSIDDVKINIINVVSIFVSFFVVAYGILQSNSYANFTESIYSVYYSVIYVLSTKILPFFVSSVTFFVTIKGFLLR